MKGFETIIEKRRDSILRNSLLSDEFINFVQKNKRPFDEMMSYYKCAIMEVADQIPRAERTVFTGVRPQSNRGYQKPYQIYGKSDAQGSS